MRRRAALKHLSQASTVNERQYETEDLELWMRDPVECIRELMGNPEFDHMVSYAPERVFSDVEGKTRRFDEMWTGDKAFPTGKIAPRGRCRSSYPSVR